MCGGAPESRQVDASWCPHFSTVITPSWMTQQISVEKCMHQGASARRERQTMFKIVTWTKQTWTKHHNTVSKIKNISKKLGCPKGVQKQ